MELDVIMMEMNVEISVEMVMLKRLDLLVFLSIPNLLLFLLLIINLNLLFNLSFLISYNFSLYYHNL